jgi:hypothetical protein
MNHRSLSGIGMLLGWTARCSALLGLLVLPGCGAAGDSGDATGEELGTDQEELYILTTALWPQRDIPVCWLTGGNATEKAWVKEVMLGQRSWASAGNVNFVGWGTCVGSGAGEIQISGGDEMVVRGGLGYHSNAPTSMELDFRASPNPETTWSVCVTHGLNREECIKSLAIHEFGHAIAYAHEQNRSDKPLACTSSTGGNNGNLTFGSFDLVSIMAYCEDAMELSGMDRRGTDRMYGPKLGPAPKLGDYNGDGQEDLLCRDVLGGGQWVDYANSSAELNGEDWSSGSGWCNSDQMRTVMKGDFNGDGRTDQLCFAIASGSLYVDYANSSGEFGGQDWSASNGFCNSAESRRVYIGDFNNDGRDDLLCHDRSSGDLWVDYASSSGQFNGINWSSSAGFCSNSTTRRLFVSDFNADGRDDLLCEDVASGGKWIDYANSSGEFGGEDWSHTIDWCSSDRAAIYVGDFNADGRADLLCHDGESGNRQIDYANSSGQFGGTDHTVANSWCAGNGDRLFIGDISGDGRDDLICHNVTTGSVLVDYANGSSQFNTTDFSTSGWCNSLSSRSFL